MTSEEHDAKEFAKPDKFRPKYSPTVVAFWREFKAVTLCLSDDDDGFNVVTFTVPDDEWTNSLDTEGRHVGVTAEGARECVPARYATVTKATVGYTMRSD